MALFNTEMYEPGMNPLEHRALGLPAIPESGREAILALQRAVSRRARLLKELIAEIAQPMPVRRTHQLPALQLHSRRQRHPDANLDGVPADLLQSAVVTLAEKAEEEVDDHRLQAVCLSKVVGDWRPPDRVLVGPLQDIFD